MNNDRAVDASFGSTLAMRGSGISPLLVNEFKPYVYGSPRSRLARAALDRAEALNGPRPATVRGIQPKRATRHARADDTSRPTT